MLYTQHFERASINENIKNKIKGFFLLRLKGSFQQSPPVTQSLPLDLTRRNPESSFWRECLCRSSWLSSGLQVRSAVRKRWHRWQDHHSLRVRVARAMSIPTSPTRISFHSIKQTTAVWTGEGGVRVVNCHISEGTDWIFLSCVWRKPTWLVYTRPLGNMCPISHKATRDSRRWGEIVGGSHLVIWRRPGRLSIHERRTGGSSGTCGHLLHPGLGPWRGAGGGERSPFNQTDALLTWSWKSSLDFY